MAIVAQMVGRNEADRYLKEVLDHLKKVVDHIVFTDDCSDDNTLQVAKDFDCFTYQTPRPMFSEHEGQLRQLAWGNLENHAKEGDWILAIDCDEKLWCSRPNLLLNDLLEQTRFEVLGVKFYHMWNRTQYRVDKAWRPTVSSRMFKFKTGGQFKQSKLACGSEPTYVVEAVRTRKWWPESGLIMQHLGYMDDADKLAKYIRYSTLDKGDFHSLAHINSIVDPDPVLVDWSSH